MSYGHIKPSSNNRYLDLISFIKNNNLERNIVVVNNWVSDKTLANIFSVADIGIALEDTDAFSIGILDIMKFGLIPILSNIKTYWDYFEEGKNCLFVNQKDSDNISDALLKSVMEIDSLKSEILPNNYDCITNNMDGEVQFAEINKMYEEILVDR